MLYIPGECFRVIWGLEYTHIYIRNDNQKKNGELHEVRVEFVLEQCVFQLHVILGSGVPVLDSRF